MSKATTKQVQKGNNKSGKGGFGDNPENRSDGSWKKEDTPRFKLEQMMKLTEAELRDVAGNESTPFFERKIATAMKVGDWKTIEAMMNQVYGTPKNEIDMKVTDEGGVPLIRGFVIPHLPKDFINIKTEPKDE